MADPPAKKAKTLAFEPDRLPRHRFMRPALLLMVPSEHHLRLASQIGVTDIVCSYPGSSFEEVSALKAKIEAEKVAGHTRKCAFWDYNTITYDQQTGRACQVELDKYDASATYGFDIFKNNRDEIMKRAADPNDPIVFVENEEGTEEFGLQAMLQTVQTMMGQVTGNPNQQVVFADDDEDDDDGC